MGITYLGDLLSMVINHLLTGMILQVGFELPLLGGGLKYFLFSPLPGEGFQFDSYFSNGLKPPTRLSYLANGWDIYIYRR